MPFRQSDLEGKIYSEMHPVHSEFLFQVAVSSTVISQSVGLAGE